MMNSKLKIAQLMAIASLGLQGVGNVSHKTDAPKKAKPAPSMALLVARRKQEREVAEWNARVDAKNAAKATHAHMKAIRYSNSKS